MDTFFNGEIIMDFPVIDVLLELPTRWILETMDHEITIIVVCLLCPKIVMVVIIGPLHRTVTYDEGREISQQIGKEEIKIDRDPVLMAIIYQVPMNGLTLFKSGM